MEGAPVKSLFDLWTDPFGLFKLQRPEARLQQSRHNGVKTFFPEVWFSQNSPSPLLENWVSIRGLETSSPHTKQTRIEWVMPSLKYKNDLEITTSTSRLKSIYEEISEKKANITSLNKNFPFNYWINQLRKKQTKQGQLKLFVLDGDQKQAFFFENTSTLEQDDLEKYKKFYKAFILELENFVGILKRRKEFRNSVILITSDRTRITTNDKIPFDTSILWEGLNFSLLTGAIKGPLTLGHIQKKHPHYSDNWPGTWGLALDPYKLDSFHDLVQELLKAPSYIFPKKEKTKNPWLTLVMLQGLKAKGHPGRIF